MGKRLVSLLLVLVMAAAFCLPVLAADAQEPVEGYQDSRQRLFRDREVDDCAPLYVEGKVTESSIYADTYYCVLEAKEGKVVLIRNDRISKDLPPIYDGTIRAYFTYNGKNDYFGCAQGIFIGYTDMDGTGQSIMDADNASIVSGILGTGSGEFAEGLPVIDLTILKKAERSSGKVSFLHHRPYNMFAQ